MSYDNLWLPRKGLKADKPDAGGAIIKNVPVFGVVKDNIDPVRAGRLRVYISGINGKDPEDEKNWTPVSYLPSYYGYIPSTSGENGYGSYKTNPTSYGFWNSPPDIGTTVICIFVNGDPNYGFYIGCVPEPEALQMVPAIGATSNVTLNEEEANKFGGTERLPVTNLNMNDKNKANSSNFLEEAKPVHSYVAGTMFQQGILRDPIRGPISSSANREAPSRVFGISTPGRPIYEGGYTEEQIAKIVKEGKQVPGLKVISRRGGHTFVMDDGDLVGSDQLIRLRTALGHQILMSDNGQTLMILHANGQSYIELGKEGTIDMYSTNSVNIRTQGDLNLHADRDINLHAAKKMNIQAESININSEKDTNHKIGTNYSVHTSQAFTHKVDGPMSLGSEGAASFASTATTYINGERINLNTGQTSYVPKEVDSIPVVAHTDTLFDPSKGFLAAPGKLLSVTSRAPAHTPWANAGQGVDVKTDVNASSQLPASPSPAVAGAYNAAASATNPSLVTTAGAATVPATGAISTALDKNTTQSLVGAVAQAAATGPAAAAVSAGAGVVNTAAGAKLAVGVTALTPEQLQQAKVVKPGSAPLMNALAASGAKPAAIMTSNMFTGKSGAENLPNLVKNTTAQVNATVTNLQNAQTALTNAGLVTGKESPQILAGFVMSGAQNGITPTLNAVKSITSNVAGAAQNLIGGAASGLTSGLGSVSNVANTIKSGSFAAGLAQNVTGGLGAISGAVGALGKITGVSGLLDAAKGVAGGAFAAIASSFKSFKPNVPQNLKEITKQNQAQVAETNPLDLAGAASGAASAVASGISNLPGGQSAISSVVNNGLGAINAVPGTEKVSGLLKNSTTAAMNNISLDKAASATADVTSSVTNAVGGINSAVSGAVSGAVSSATNVVGGLTSAATGAVGGLTSAATGAVGAAGGLVAGAAGAVGGLTSAASGAASSLTGAFDKLKSGAGSLAGLAATGLPPGAAAQLNSALSSLSAIGSTPIKLPTVGENTTNRGEISSAVTGILGSGVPSPNYSGAAPAENPIDAFKRKEAERNAALAPLKKDVEDAVKVLKEAKQKYEELSKSLPEGDPQLAAANEAWSAASKDAVTKLRIYGEAINKER